MARPFRDGGRGRLTGWRDALPAALSGRPPVDRLLPDFGDPARWWDMRVAIAHHAHTPLDVIGRMTLRDALEVMAALGRMMSPSERETSDR